MSGSTAGLSPEAAEESLEAAPSSSFTLAGLKLTLCGPAALAAWLAGSGMGTVPADEETSANAQSTPIKEGATNLFTTSPALLGHPGDHPAPESQKQH
jgi:hypothetical protein